jgi:hypothetical protein
VADSGVDDGRLGLLPEAGGRRLEGHGAGGRGRRRARRGRRGGGRGRARRPLGYGYEGRQRRGRGRRARGRGDRARGRGRRGRRGCGVALGAGGHEGDATVGQPSRHQLEHRAVRGHVDDAVGLLHLDGRGGVHLRQYVHLQLGRRRLGGLQGLLARGLLAGAGAVGGPEAGGQVGHETALNGGLEAGEAADLARALGEARPELVEDTRVGGRGQGDLLALEALQVLDRHLEDVGLFQLRVSGWL